MQNNNKKRFNFWPYGITISIVAVVILCIDMIVISLKNPVYMDDFYLEKYQNVDENINKIITSQKKFDKKYTIEVDMAEKFSAKNNSIKIKIVDKITAKNAKNAKIELLITRPDSSKFDKKLSVIEIKDGYYIFQPFDIEKKGRWQIMLKVSIGKLVSFTRVETYATL